ncbi:hypothetical protein [Flavobacterium selenitireducens]|nr:hypothetical protein [Flavobacterium selenitireducens]MBD3582680.1 hypothetical protein [Flavobacterium selenitireducens]
MTAMRQVTGGIVSERHIVFLFFGVAPHRNQFSIQDSGGAGLTALAIFR